MIQRAGSHESYNSSRAIGFVGSLAEHIVSAFLRFAVGRRYAYCNAFFRKQSLPKSERIFVLVIGSIGIGSRSSVRI